MIHVIPVRVRKDLREVLFISGIETLNFCFFFAFFFICRHVRNNKEFESSFHD